MFLLQTATTKLVAGLGIAALVAASYGAVFLWGNSNGKDIIRKAWDLEKAQYTVAIEKQVSVYDTKRASYIKRITELEGKVSEDEIKYKTALVALERDYAGRLQQQSQAATTYQRAAAGSETQRKALADHAAELHRTLVEGRRVVGELREALGLRDQQIQRLEEERQYELDLH